MIDLVYGSFLATLIPIVLHVGVRIVSAVAAALTWRDDQPVVLSRHTHFTFFSPASGRPEHFKHGH